MINRKLNEDDKSYIRETLSTISKYHYLINHKSDMIRYEEPSEKFSLLCSELRGYCKCLNLSFIILPDKLVVQRKQVIIAEEKLNEL